MSQSLLNANVLPLKIFFKFCKVIKEFGKSCRETLLSDCIDGEAVFCVAQVFFQIRLE